MPVDIIFDLAILVAVLGLIAKGICVAVLGGHPHKLTENRASPRASRAALDLPIMDHCDMIKRPAGRFGDGTPKQEVQYVLWIVV